MPLVIPVYQIVRSKDSLESFYKEYLVPEVRNIALIKEFLFALLSSNNTAVKKFELRNLYYRVLLQKPFFCYAMYYVFHSTNYNL